MKKTIPFAYSSSKNKERNQKECEKAEVQDNKITHCWNWNTQHSINLCQPNPIRNDTDSNHHLYANATILIYKVYCCTTTTLINSSLLCTYICRSILSIYLWTRRYILSMAEVTPDNLTCFLNIVSQPNYNAKAIHSTIQQIIG